MKYLSGEPAKGLKCCDCGRTILHQEGCIQFGKWFIEKWNQSLCFDCVHTLQELLKHLKSEE